MLNYCLTTNITITTKSTMTLNIVRRYQNNMIENQKSTDHDDNNDRKRQTQFTNTEDRKLKRVNTKAEQKTGYELVHSGWGGNSYSTSINRRVPIDKI